MLRSEIYSSIIETIGDTPLIELSRVKGDLNGRILMKLEYFLPGASKKDRVARQIIEEAKSSGQLRAGQTVVELTSGNTGTGLAIVCRALAHPFVAVMSKGNSIERRVMMAALGAEIILVDQSPGGVPGKVSGADLELVKGVTDRVVRERAAFRADQFNLPGNFNAHYAHTAPEILRQTVGQFDAFVDFVGTGGSFGGCAKAFKEFNPAIRCYVAEPAESAVLAGSPVTNSAHKIQGGGYQWTDLVALDDAQIDGYLKVTDDEAIDAARRLARDEGIFAGFSSGANLAAAEKLLQGDCRGKTIVVLACDSGMKYLSTDLWDSRSTLRRNVNAVCVT
jgi:cysteine synthase A